MAKEFPSITQADPAHAGAQLTIEEINRMTREHRAPYSMRVGKYTINLLDYDHYDHEDGQIMLVKRKTVAEMLTPEPCDLIMVDTKTGRAIVYDPTKARGLTR